MESSGNSINFDEAYIKPALVEALGSEVLEIISGEDQKLRALRRSTTYRIYNEIAAYGGDNLAKEILSSGYVPSGEKISLKDHISTYDVSTPERLQQSLDDIERMKTKYIDEL